jgi:SAM-dependent methyltransferase
MQPNVADLEEFYRSALGRAVQAMIARRLNALWPDLGGMDALTLGYGIPYCRQSDTPRRRVLAMPARQGVEQWPASGGVQSLLVDDEALPFAEASFDRVLIIHGLEESRGPSQLLLEVHRILAPQGRVICVVPNRNGLWAHHEASPFGHGRAYSKGQMRALMRECGLQTSAWAKALYAPPTRFSASLSAMRAWEQAGERLWPAFGGVIMVEASKQVLISPPKIRPLLIPALGNIKP